MSCLYILIKLFRYLLCILMREPFRYPGLYIIVGGSCRHFVHICEKALCLYLYISFWFLLVGAIL